MAGNMMGQMGGFQGKPNMNLPAMGNGNKFPFNLNMGQGGNRDKPKQVYDNNLCLYIGNLTPTTFDNDIFKFFKNRGYNLRNAQVMLNNETRKSKCFGYLNFYKADEAERCLNEMNNSSINGKQIVLNKKKTNNYEAQANIIIRNIAKEMTQAELFTLCKQYGNIVSCKLETSGAGVSKGFCYVQYENKDDAQKAINALNGSTQNGKQIQVIVHSKKGEREDTGEHYRNLFVKNIPKDFTINDLKALFAEFGTIESCEVKGNGADIGYVMFEKHEQAKAAIEALDAKKEVKGQTIFVSRFIYSSENNQNSQKAPPISQQLNQTFKSNIFIRNIPKDVNEEEFRDKMTQAGKIISLKMKENFVTGEGGKMIVTNKIGYVCYEKVEDAQKCIRLYDQTNTFGFGHKALQVQFWQSKYDLYQENEEKNINQVKKFIHFIKYEMQ